MTVPASNSHHEYIADGGTTTFIYSFQATLSSEIEVRVDGAVNTLNTQYTLTGVGTQTGGTVVFNTAPADGLVVSVRRLIAYEQLLALIPNAPLPALSLEGRLDLIVKMIQQVDEELSRRPTLAVAIAAAYRDMVYPTPVPLKLIGWDALGTGIAYYDPAIVQVEVSDTAHFVYAESQTVVAASAGQIQITATGAFPVGCIRIGAIVRVTTTFGATQSLTTFSAGSPDVIDRWGAALSSTSSDAPIGANNPGSFRMFGFKPLPSGEDVVLSADSGAFDATGAALVTTSYFTMVAA